MDASVVYPIFPDGLPETETHGKYVVRFADSHEDLRKIQRLRFEVFNLELGEGLEQSYDTGLDQDEFDEVCHHLIVEDKASGATAGTYRIQTTEMARAYRGFYSESEFKVSEFPEEVLADAVEVGRAAVAKDYRNRHVLFMLWKGLASYITKNRKQFLFGCCSLTSQDSAEGKRTMDFLEENHHVHPEIRIQPQATWRCYEDGYALPSDEPAMEIALPRLFRTYLRYGAKVCGPPAIDRQFKTIDFLVLLDTGLFDEQTRSLFFG